MRWLDLSEYARQHGVETKYASYFGSADLYIKDGVLCAEVLFADEVISSGIHVVSIDENLFVQKVEN